MHQASVARKCALGFPDVRCSPGLAGICLEICMPVGTQQWSMWGRTAIIGPLRGCCGSQLSARAVTSISWRQHRLRDALRSTASTALSKLGPTRACWRGKGLNGHMTSSCTGFRREQICHGLGFALGTVRCQRVECSLAACRHHPDAGCAPPVTAVTAGPWQALPACPLLCHPILLCIYLAPATVWESRYELLVALLC